MNNSEVSGVCRRKRDSGCLETQSQKRRCGQGPCAGHFVGSAKCPWCAFHNQGPGLTAAASTAVAPSERGQHGAGRTPVTEGGQASQRQAQRNTHTRLFWAKISSKTKYFLLTQHNMTQQYFPRLVVSNRFFISPQRWWTSQWEVPCPVQNGL